MRRMRKIPHSRGAVGNNVKELTDKCVNRRRSKVGTAPTRGTSISRCDASAIVSSS